VRSCPARDGRDSASRSANTLAPVHVSNLSGNPRRTIMGTSGREEIFLRLSCGPRNGMFIYEEVKAGTSEVGPGGAHWHGCNVKSAVDLLCLLILSFVLLSGIGEAEDPLPLNISSDWACGFIDGAMGHGLAGSIRNSAN